MHIRSCKKLQNEVSINDTIGVDREGNEITLMDIVEDDSEQVIEKVALKMQIITLYEKMHETLAKREYEIITWRFGLNNKPIKTQHEIAKNLGISRSYVYGVWYCKLRLEILKTTGFAGLEVLGDMTTLNVSSGEIKTLKSAWNKEKCPIYITELKKQRPFIFLVQK